MSTTKQSPLGANSASGLLQDTGLTINPVAAQYMGVSKVNATYTPGTTVTSTCLDLLTSAINEAYTNINITSTTYDNLISIGSSTIPALGNSKPPTYVITDPSGEWSGQANTGYAVSGTTGQGQEATWIPYDTTNDDDSITQWGFMRLFALEAWNEFNYNGIPSGSVRYRDFVSSFMSCVSSLNYINTMTNTFVNGAEFLKGVYSNMNDLISAEVTNVTLSTTAFGQDCITLGKVIDLSYIQKFGMPSALLQIIKKYNAITQSLSLALLASGVVPSDIENIAAGTTIASQLQEQQIYGAFLIILGQDLKDILVPLNCKTKNLESLADLLNVKKIFPNSYQSLTVPIYNIVSSPTNSKTYYLIYDGTSVNNSLNTPAIKDIVGTIILPGMPKIVQDTTGNNFQNLPKGFDSYLVGIMPTDIAIAAGAFSYTMQQIKNIQYIDFEKFSQVVYNIETTKNLNLVNGTDVPADTASMDLGSTTTGLGSGPNKTYTVSDFFGCMSGLPYDWKTLTQLILNVQTTTLSTIYSDMYTAINDDVPSLDTVVQEYIDSANAEILRIYNTNTTFVNQLISLYDQFGSQLMIEQRARFINLPAVPVPRDTRLNPYPIMVISFVDSLAQFSANTLPHMESQTIEAISDLNDITGQSIVAAMREQRNAVRLQSIGVPLDGIIPGELDNISAQQLLCNGTTTYTVGGITYSTTPSTERQTIDNVEYMPEPLGVLVMPNDTLQAPVYVIDGNPLDVGQATYPGSFAGSGATKLVPINLNTTYSSGTRLPTLITVQEAIDQVIHCNCDCWIK